MYLYQNWLLVGCHLMNLLKYCFRIQACKNGSTLSYEFSLPENFGLFLGQKCCPIRIALVEFNTKRTTLSAKKCFSTFKLDNKGWKCTPCLLLLRLFTCSGVYSYTESFKCVKIRIRTVSQIFPNLLAMRAARQFSQTVINTIAFIVKYWKEPKI